MARIHSTRLNEITSLAGVNSLASAALLTPAEFMRRLEGKVPANEAHETLKAARKKRDELLVLEKSIVTRASPLLPAAIRVGLRHPDISLQEYEEWFGGRATHYASPGDVSSVFSPAAYLTEMYREARGLYPEGSRWHIDTRRPDLANLILSQENMDGEVSALDLSNELLFPHVRDQLTRQGKLRSGNASDEEVLETLAGHVQSSGTPYHHHHARLRQVRQQKDPNFSLLSKAPDVIKHLSGATLAGMAFDISPALNDLLLDEIPEEEEAAEVMFRKYFGEHATPEIMLHPASLRRWYGLTDEEVRWFVGGLNQYNNNVMTMVAGEYIKRVTVSSARDHIATLEVYPESDTVWRVRGAMTSTAEYGIYVDISNISGKLITWRRAGEKISAGEIFERDLDINERYNEPDANITAFPRSGSFSVRLAMHRGSDDPNGGGTNSSRTVDIISKKAHAFALKLNKAIRLYRATGLSPWVLEDVVNSGDSDQITDETLDKLFRSVVLMKRFGISHEDALVMAGSVIASMPHGGEPSQFDRLFNTPPLMDGGFSADGTAITLKPEDADSHADIKATLKRAYQTDDSGLYHLKMIYHAGGATASMKMSLKEISDMYNLSLWANGLALSPLELRQLAEMCGLPENLYEAPPAIWHALFKKMHATMDWLKKRGWTVADLMLMTRDVADIAPGTETQNLLSQLRDYIRTGSHELAGVPPASDITSALSPLISGIFSLNSDTAGQALLTWADKAKPGGMGLPELWSALSGEQSDITAPGPVAFAYGLAQMALIYHGTNVTPDAMMMFVSIPDRLGPESAKEGVLLCSADVVRNIGDYSRWVATLSEAAGSITAGLKGGGVDALNLSRGAGLDVALVVQAMNQAAERGDLAGSSLLTSYAEIRVVMQWVEVSEAFGVTPDAIAMLLAMDYAGEPGTSVEWGVWKRVADTFVAGLSAQQARSAMDNVAAGLSTALCGFLLSTDSNLAPFARDRERLYQYLLADNLNGPLVKTSRIADAMAALQTFIHRTLSSPEERGAVMRDAPGRQFFLDWRQWNARYSTWAAYRKLMYYPENYIDPTIRVGQTRMMDGMLQSLGQSQINTDTVGDAFLEYLTGFEEVANLETLNGYHDNPEPDSGKTWFVGCNRSEAPEYWWRTVDEGKRDDSTGLLPANAWTGWEKINCGLQPWNNCVRPVVYKSRLYLAWLERLYTPETKSDGTVTDKWRWLLKISGLRYDGNWMPAVSEDVTGGVPAAAENIGFYVSNWAPTDTMLVLIYDQTAPTTTAKGWSVFDNMAIQTFDAPSANIALLIQYGQLQTADSNPVINQFIGAQVVAHNDLLTPAPVPPRFAQFELQFQSLTPDTAEDDSSYDLTLQVRGNITARLDDIWDVNSSLFEALFIAHPEAMVNEDCELLTTKRAAVGIEGLFSLVILRTPEAVYVAAHTTGDEEGFAGLTVYEISFDAHVYAPSVFVQHGPFAIAKLTAINPGPVNPATLIHINIVHPPVIYPVLMTPEMGIVSSFPVNPFTGEGYPWSETLIPKNNIKVYLDDTSVPAASDYTLNENWTGAFEVNKQGIRFDTWNGNQHSHAVNFEMDFDGKIVSRRYTVKVMRSANKPPEVTVERNDRYDVQYLRFGSDDKITRLNTLFARRMTERAAQGINTILSWDTQQMLEPPMLGNGEFVPMDFAGANSIYFWELFYYTPMMVVQRYLQEERYDLAEQWLQYVFNPAGYFEGLTRGDRIWNVRPLQEDTSWNDEPLQSWDPDAVAQNDPMHYKLNAFMRLLDIIIGRGDSAYRKLERDTLAEAKVWYSLALNLLGEKPWIARNEGWSSPSLADAASPERLMMHMDALSALSQRRPAPAEKDRAGISGGSLFLPEANEFMLGYWDKLQLRMYNLRHNLTLDGQVLNLPLYAEPADPKALLSAAVAAEAGGANGLPEFSGLPGIRFSPLLESARSMAGQLVQFGSAIQQVLERQDAEALSELLNTQGVEMSGISLSLQRRALEDIAAERKTLEQSLSNVSTRREHYYRLYQENTSPGEKQAVALTASASGMGLASKAMFTTGGALAAAPTIFGLANGGMRPEGVPNAAGHIMTLMSEADSIKAQRIHQEEIFRRRREEWDIQYRMAEGEMNVIQAQLDALNVRETAINMQIEQAQLQQAQMQAQLALLQGKFTGKAMYSWMRGQLAVIFYQYYDLTVSRCLMAQKALQWEKGDNTLYLRAGTWNGAWAGLMCGEGLLLNLAQMDDAWTRWQRREKEITRTVSLAEFFSEKLAGQEQGTPNTLQDAIGWLLDQETGEVGEGDNKIMLTEGAQGESVLGVSFSLADLKFENDGYGLPDKVRRIRSIAVSVPALLGPYQDLRATVTAATSALPPGCNQMALSHAMMDSGRFVAEGGDYRWLPFEGLKLTDETEGVISTPMSISFADALTGQKALLESLSDIILHIQYTLRD
ncbi:neuraminidase-like domain-containing protein [Enterobacter cloacae]|uniref:Tc toxin subunit A-related protein n=1 Tax=Enterobacter cloacae TaxID=550 RepID=UPI0025403024|nr:neuraminidase-like domain-containing protein [Enterobacter cloacae]WIF62926.1 neuraminidase-like domain-containing protein [Enterobacter cloacae]